MNSLYRHMICLLLLAFSLSSKAQFDPDEVCTVRDGKIVFRINSQWTAAQKKEISRLFDLDSSLLADAFKGKTVIYSGKEKWEVKKIALHLVELSKNLNTNPALHMNQNDIFLADESLINPVHSSRTSAGRESVTYGVNHFNRDNLFHYEKEIALFYLPGFKNAKKVFLAGSFNDWSTNKTPMQLSDSGWIAKVSIAPGKYWYKFIVDGKWMTDPYNKRIENDGQGNDNSVVFCYNYLFKLEGFLNARVVVVAGSFNKWNRNELKMNKTSYGWALPMYLRDGSYSYKFIVGNEWITDPANKNTLPNSAGTSNSYLGIGDAYVFRLKGYKNASRVILSGSFNNWNTNELYMEKVNDGWELPYILAAGNYEYKFIVDGRWMPDPANPHTIGSGDMTNSVLAFKANYTFVLDKFPGARSVIVSGSFNNWSRDGFRMAKKEGKWVFPVYLKPGKYTYKFVVDGNWILDPDNRLWEQNEFGTGNSVLWINQ